MNKEETKQVICTRIINKNIRNVMLDKPLTISLKELNQDCRFKQFYNDWFNIKNKKKIREERKEYYQKLEVKERKRIYNKAYFQKPEVKERMKEYFKTYNQKPEVKEKRKVYRQKPEVKEKKKIYNRMYFQRPEVKERMREYYWKKKLEKKNFLIFVYGTLKKGFLNHIYLKNAVFVKKSSIKGFTAYDLGAFPTIVEGENEIFGEIYKVNKSELEVLDYLENYPVMYDRKIVKTTSGEEVFVYFMNNKKLERFNNINIIKDGVWRKCEKK